MADPPSPSWRKPVGTLGIVGLILVWAVAAVTLVDALGLPAWAQGILYLIAGIAWLWLFPLRRLLRWMECGVWRG